MKNKNELNFKQMLESAYFWFGFMFGMVFISIFVLILSEVLK